MKLKKLPASAGASGTSDPSTSSSSTRGCNFVNAFSGSFQLILLALLKIISKISQEYARPVCVPKV